MTLFRQIQRLLETTYGRTGINLERFLLPRERNRELALQAGAISAQLPESGRVFLRVVDNQLKLGIYYAPRIITQLERHDPRHGLTDDNIFPLIVFLEELDHAVHAALKFRETRCDIHSEEFVRDLELQAKVDTYLILQRFCGEVTEADRCWLRACLFDAIHHSHTDPTLQERYRQTNRLARRYIRHLDRLTPRSRTNEIRRFRRLSYRRKQRRIATVPS